MIAVRSLIVPVVEVAIVEVQVPCVGTAIYAVLSYS
jgi:hypothetical protein